MEYAQQRPEYEENTSAVVDAAFFYKAIIAPEFFADHELAIQLAARDGDRPAFGLLARYYNASMLSQARRMLKSSGRVDFAQDAVQTTYTKVLELIDQPDIEKRPIPRINYFSRTLTTTIMDYRRSAYVAKTYMVDLHTTESAPDDPTTIFGNDARHRPMFAPNAGDIAEISAIKVDASLLLRGLLEGLTKRRRLVLAKRFIEGKSEATTAQELGVSVNTINEATRLALGQLRQAIAEKNIKRN